MQISRIKISNILGVEELDFSPAGFTEIAGPNGSGKTSVLEAVKAALQGGHDATLLRKGADKGEVVLVLDDGTEIKRRVGEKASTTDVVRGGKKIARSGETLKALTDMLSVNPVDFLTARKQDRVRVLLEAMPLEADAEKLTEIVGFDVKPAPGVHAIQQIQQVYTQVYDERTGTNRAVREKEGTIKQLRDAIPPAPPGLDGDEAALDARLHEIDAAKTAELERISNKLDGIRKSTQANIEQIKADAQARIDAIRAEMQQKIDAEQGALADIESRAGTQREKSLQKFAAEREPVAAQLATIRTNRDLAARRAQTLDTIETLETELETLSEDAERQTAALAALDQYKSDLLASLPIPGLEVRDGEVFRDDVPFDRLNTAQQVDVAVEIAKLRAGDLGVICVDGLELLDSKALQAFRARALDSGLQLFITRVADGDELSINSED